MGIRSGFIRLQSGEGRWLGGAQAELAPHGRGPGWGTIGASRNRIDTLRVLEAIQESDPDDTIRQALTSALSELVGNTDLAVFAVPDTPAHGEAFRDRYLGLLKRVGGLRPLLLWRPVAALLGWIAADPPEACAGCRVAILSLMADGIHLAVLSLEKERHGNDWLLVPERSKPGQRIGASFQGQALVEIVQRRLVQESGLSAEVVESGAMSPWRFAVGAQTPQELVRLRSNRGWKKLPRLDYVGPQPDAGDLEDDVLEGLGAATVLLVEGPFSSNLAWRSEVLAALKARTQLPRRVAPLDGKAVARGCLEAATRHRLRQPIYFDFLPQLQINAMVGEAPQFVDLIARGARCPGGQSFHADAPGTYVVDKSATLLTLWLFKDDFERGRKAEVELTVTPDRRYPLSVSVEQTPGQGFAEVHISSSEFDALRRSPITLTWGRMKEIDRTREEILEVLRSSSSIRLRWPNTAVQQGNASPWLKRNSRGDLIALLASYRAGPLLRHVRIDPDGRELLGILRRRFSSRPLNSDGSVPDSMTGPGVRAKDAAAQLDQALSKLEKDLADLQYRFGQRIERRVLGDILAFASWCFWRCPPGIADVFLGVYEGEYSHDINHTLLCEGVARVVSTPGQLRRYFKALERRLKGKDRISTAEYAGLARVLGTSDEAAVVLNGALADRVVEATVRTITGEFEKDIDTAYKKLFKTALLMLAALLRHRKVRPEFLDPDEDTAAQELLRTLELAEERNLDFVACSDRLAAVRRFRANADIIVDLKDFIYREGRNPNIIVHINAIEEE